MGRNATRFHPNATHKSLHTLYLSVTAAPSTYTLLSNPTTHYYNPSDNGIISSNPNTWIPYSSNTPKSIYDPCPYGYRVPTDGSWNGMTGNTWTQYAIIGGVSWNSSWWPATGGRENSNARLYAIGLWTGYWSSSPYPSYAYNSYNLSFNYSNGVNPSNYINRCYGYSVRCIEEKDNNRRRRIEKKRKMEEASRSRRRMLIHRACEMASLRVARLRDAMGYYSL